MVQTGVNKKLFVNEILPGQEFKISILGGNIHLKIAFGQKLTKKTFLHISRHGCKHININICLQHFLG